MYPWGEDPPPSPACARVAARGCEGLPEARQGLLEITRGCWLPEATRAGLAKAGQEPVHVPTGREGDLSPPWVHGRLPGTAQGLSETAKGWQGLAEASQ